MDLELLDSNIFIDELNAGVESAFKTLFDIHFRQLCFFSNKIVNDQDAAKDIVQEVFVSYWKSGVEVENIAGVRAYLYRSVQNRSLNHISRHKKKDEISNSLPHETMTESNYLREQIEAEVINEIFEAIKELPEQCRRIFELSYIFRYEIKQIAEDLNISVNTVKTQRLRAKKYLKERLKNVFPILLFLFYN